MSLPKILVSRFSSSASVRKEIPSNLKGKSKTAQDWLIRQLNDPYIKAAKLHNFRCRSAFKLLEVDTKYEIFKPGHTVIDCGAAPGSWSQVAVAKTNANKAVDAPVGRVISIDKLNIFPIEGVTVFNQCDFTTAETQSKIIKLLNGDKIDIVMSDIAPNATGVKDMDHELLVEIAYKVLRFAVTNSKVDGTCLIKFWMGRRLQEFEENAKKFYSKVKLVKPAASRSDSSEIYLLARYFKGLQTNGES